MTLYKLTNKIGNYYVIASGPTEAEQKLMKILNDNDYGFNDSRMVTSFEVIAQSIDDQFLTGKFLVL